MASKKNNPTPYLEYMPLEQLIRAPRNPKQHDLGTIHDSLTRFGFINPTLIDERTGKLVAGHGRLDTLQRLKAMGKNPPARVIEQNGSWLIPVIRGISFENDQEAEAYLLADNQLTMIGGWDEEELAQTLSDLAAQGEHMLQGIGWDADDLDEMLKKLGKDLENTPEIEEEPLDPADELLQKYQVKQGDLWQVGDHFISCNDCRTFEVVEAMLYAAGAKKVDGAFTSPPYAEQRSKKGEWYGGIPEDQYVQWWYTVQDNIGSCLAPMGSFFLNIKPNVVDGARVLYVFDLVLAMCRDWDWHLIDEFCWERLSAPGSWHNRFKNGFEPVYQFSKDTRINFFREAVATEGSGVAVHGGNKSTGNYYNTNNKVVEWDQVLPSNRIPSFGNASGEGHPAAFPVGLPEFFMRAFSESDSLWLDPFAGSGTVGVAAHKNGRSSLMIELEPKYVAVMLERMYKLTGETPIRAVSIPTTVLE